MKAIIGGTGLYETGEKVTKRIVDTDYGKVELDILDMGGEEVAFLARHGKEHSIPPHLVNYRANLMALKQLGVSHIFATAAVGSCNLNYAPGDLVSLKDFIDFTKSRPMTFFEGGEKKVKHVDMSQPYSKELKEVFYKVAEELELEIKGEAVYVCTEGPRFETASEIKMYQSLGGDVVGMTNVPEVVLANELEIEYFCIGIITNWCTGFKGDIFFHHIEDYVEKNKHKLTKTFLKAFKRLADTKK